MFRKTTPTYSTRPTRPTAQTQSPCAGLSHRAIARCHPDPPPRPAPTPYDIVVFQYGRPSKKRDCRHAYSGFKRAALRPQPFTAHFSGSRLYAFFVTLARRARVRPQLQDDSCVTIAAIARPAIHDHDVDRFPSLSVPHTFTTKRQRRGGGRSMRGVEGLPLRVCQ